VVIHIDARNHRPHGLYVNYLHRETQFQVPKRWSGWREMSNLGVLALFTRGWGGLHGDDHIYIHTVHLRYYGQGNHPAFGQIRSWPILHIRRAQVCWLCDHTHALTQTMLSLTPCSHSHHGGPWALRQGSPNGFTLYTKLRAQSTVPWALTPVSQLTQCQAHRHTCTFLLTSACT